MSQHIPVLSWRRVSAGIVGLLAGCLAVGCGQSAVQRAPVHGRVTLDGKPVEKGSVSFIPVKGDQPTSAGGRIENGEYRAEVAPGPMKVVVRAPKVIGQRKAYNTPDSPMVDVIGELIPAQYNDKSSLTAEIGPDTRELDFDLQSKK